MSVKLVSAKQAAQLHGVKIAVYGQAGSGKTTLATTAPSPLIISAEAGLLSIRHTEVPVIIVNTIDDVREAYTFCASSADAKGFQTICLDSLSEIGEVVLNAEKKKVNDNRQAYMALAEQMADLIRAFRDLPERHVYMSAKMERSKDDMSGAMLYGPSLPGQRLAQQLPYFFDEVFALRVERDPEGNLQRWLQTQPDIQYQAKDRSGVLDLYETPDLSAIISKISTSAKQEAA